MGLRKINWRLLVAILYWMWGLFARGGYPILQLRERMSPLGYPISCGHTHTTASSCGDHTYGDTKIQIHPKRDTDTNMASSSWSSAFFYDFRSGKTCFSLTSYSCGRVCLLGSNRTTDECTPPICENNYYDYSNDFDFEFGSFRLGRGHYIGIWIHPWGLCGMCFVAHANASSCYFTFAAVLENSFVEIDCAKLHLIVRLFLICLAVEQHFIGSKVFKTVPDGQNYNNRK